MFDIEIIDKEGSYILVFPEGFEVNSATKINNREVLITTPTRVENSVSMEEVPEVEKDEYDIEVTEEGYKRVSIEGLPNISNKRLRGRTCFKHFEVDNEGWESPTDYDSYNVLNNLRPKNLIGKAVIAEDWEIFPIYSMDKWYKLNKGDVIDVYEDSKGNLLAELSRNMLNRAQWCYLVEAPISHVWLKHGVWNKL